MKYRVRLDLSFAEESDARAILEQAAVQAEKAVSLNEGSEKEEVSFAELELCRHEEGLPCLRLERLEVRKEAA